jgi:hypothetical protein
VSTFIELVQNRDQYAKEISESVDLRRKLRSLAVLSTICFGLYGFIIGSQHSLKQAVSSCVKLPILFLLTLVICTPALFIFSAFFGSRRSLLQTLAILLAGTAITGIALIALSPVTLFFIVTTRSYQFFKIFNVLFFSVSGLMGIGFFYFLSAHSSPDSTGQKQMARGLLLRFWFLLYAFVGTQLAWTLRPFFGAPGLPFEIVREVGGNFYTDLFQSLGHLFGPR